MDERKIWPPVVGKNHQGSFDSEKEEIDGILLIKNARRHITGLEKKKDAIYHPGSHTVAGKRRQPSTQSDSDSDSESLLQYLSVVVEPAQLLAEAQESKQKAMLRIASVNPNSEDEAGPARRRRLRKYKLCCDTL